jgi:flagellar basal-body rod protein FlgF
MIDFTQGALQQTDRALDMALEGPGFFTVQTADGLRYTRDGGFTRDESGRLTTGEGHLVLGTDGNPIRIQPGKLQALPDGTLTVDDQTIGKLAIVEFSLEQPLKKAGSNQFVARNEGDQP